MKNMSDKIKGTLELAAFSFSNYVLPNASKDVVDWLCRKQLIITKSELNKNTNLC
jgi:hypothetical protein